MKVSTAFEAQLGGLSIEDAINQYHERLKICFNRLCSNENYNDFKQTIVEEINNGLTTEEMDIGCRFEYLARIGPNFRLIPIRLAIASCIQSQSAFDSGDSENAWSFLSKASSYAEMAFNEPIRHDEVRQKITESGVLARQIKINLVKAEAIRLLNKNSPQGGWKYKSSAIKSIEKPLYEFILKLKNRKSSKPILTETNLSNTLSRWSLEKGSAISAAFNANITKKHQNPSSDA